MIALIDYGAGNTASVANVLKDLNTDYIITQKESEICKSDKIIFPGVGEASYAIKKLNLYNLINLLRVIKKPFLGICLGMQLMCERSEEGNVNCLGVFPTYCKKFEGDDIKIPHMGWNKVEFSEGSKLFDGIPNGQHFYFAHSYYVPVNVNTSSICNHGVDFTASMQKDNYYGVQFHPEKSGEYGINIIRNFLEKC
ncbi:MAG: imidazole glycerol phosphate synthase subunit HisH [Ignavibacteriae bacterium HGW-Ignavibacteriae-2]|jgi:glutamine amidotransferase|nr:MAG: imidazole glycerol phosphate synthase subunit HisH [Ignavibacteriae bacterium HGW-Ignavibacteriae-2]